MTATETPWLPHLPIGWTAGRVGNVATAWTSNVDKHSIAGEPAVRLCNYTDVYKNNLITEDLKFMEATARVDQIERFRLRRGDTVITKDSETADDIGVPAFVAYEADDLVCGYHLAIVRPNPSRIAPKYMYWVMASQATSRQWAILAAGVTRVGIRSNDLSKASIPIPPLGVQHEISDYLDGEVARIDTLIAEQETLIAMLRERRQAVIDRHFFGTDGKRPTTVKRVLRPLDRPSVPGLGVVTAYRDGMVTLRSNRREEGYTFSDTENGYQEVRPGDLVFHALDGFAGAVGISDSHGNASPVYHVCEVTSGEDSAYVAMLLRHLGASGFLATQAPNVRQRSIDFRNWSTFARVPLALPTREEQSVVVADIHSQTARIDNLTAEIERFIDLSKERRAALITAAVTGQIDVRDQVDQGAA